MKLTQRGKDYLKASLYGAIVSSIFDVRLILALCLSLFIAAGISEIILRTATTGSIQVELSDPHLTCFKGNSATESITVNYKRKRFVRVEVSAIEVPDGIETIADKSLPESLTFSFKPKYSGRFKVLTVKFEFLDPLGLFSKTIDLVREEFVIDCYPSSLLSQIKPSKPMTLALGERTGRTHGSGQEFYSIDEYSPSVERKNIFWKRIAAMPDERLLVKVREANIPRSLSIGLIRTSDRGQEELAWMDLACEGAGVLGKNIFALGCEVNLIFNSEDKVVRLEASDLPELSEAIMQMSLSEKTDIETTSEILSDSDLCVTGLRELEMDLLALAVARKPSLLIEDKDTFPRTIGNLSVIYSGNQDVTGLINRVLGI
ncbi:MAG TPA: hypothetical protein VN739_08705 [Nitrososphaerales archaeon]|nr:hypothetical protein [Nitrososphaerales archaeon]